MNLRATGALFISFISASSPLQSISAVGFLIAGYLCGGSSKWESPEYDILAVHFLPSAPNSGEHKSTRTKQTTDCSHPLRSGVPGEGPSPSLGSAPEGASPNRHPKQPHGTPKPPNSSDSLVSYPRNLLPCTEPTPRCPATQVSEETCHADS